MSFEKLFFRRSYYLLVALTSEGQLIFEEDTEGVAYGVRLNDRNFLNGARHSVYYVRENNTTMLLIDREHVQLLPIPILSLGDYYDTPGSTEIQLGGLNTTDSRFAAYKGYTGCLSNVVISINGGPIMKPLEEYMLFTKQGSETVRATIPAGVRSAQCAVFHAQPRGLEPQRNDSVGHDRGWVEDPPERILYKSQYSDATQEEQDAGTYIFIALCCLFVGAVIGCIYEVWRSARKDRRRRRSAAAAASKSPSPSGSQRWQPQQYTDSLVTTTGIKTIGFKITDDEKRPNGTHMKATAKEYKPLPNTEPKELMNDKKVHIKDEEPEKKELLGSMEDLREEPELEECEEEEDENEEKTELTEEDDQEEQDEDNKKDDDEEEEEKEEEGEEEKDDSQEDEVLLKSASMDNDTGQRSKAPERSPTSTDTRKPLVLNMSPIYLSDDCRTYGNPLSYLGGPRLQPRNRNSIESVLSLD